MGAIVTFKNKMPDIIPAFPLVGETINSKMRNKPCKTVILDRNGTLYKVNIIDAETGAILYKDIWLAESKFCKK